MNLKSLFPQLLIDRYKNRKVFISMNWPTFILGGTWFGYRKMPLFGMLIFPLYYSLGTIILHIVVFTPVSSYLNSTHHFSPVQLKMNMQAIGFLCVILLNLLPALFANTIYLNRINKHIAKGHEISKCTGTSVTLAVISFILTYFVVSASFINFNLVPLYL